MATFGQAIQTVATFDPGRFVSDVETLRNRAQQDADEVGRRADEHDWTGMLDTASNMLHRGEGRIHRLLGGRRSLNETDRAARALNELLAERDAGAGTASRKAIVADLRDLNERADWTMAPEPALEDLSAGETDVSDPRLDLRENAGLPVYEDMFEHQRNLAVWYAAAGYGSLARGMFYLHAERTDRVEHPPEVRERIEDELDEQRAEVRERFRELYGAVSSGDWEALETAATRAASHPLEVFGDFAAMARTVTEGRRFEEEAEGGSPGQAADLAATELELHRTLRRLTMLLAAGHLHRFLARRARAREQAREAARDAAGKDFASHVRDGVNRDLDELAGDPDAHDGRFVETEGFADRVRYDPDDAATRLDLVDRLHDVRVPAFVPFRDLTRWHLRDGAYVRLHGDFEADSDHADGPEIQIDVVNVGENADESWLDALAHQLSQAEIFEVYPSHGNVLWTHEQPPKGGENA